MATRKNDVLVLIKVREPGLGFSDWRLSLIKATNKTAFQTSECQCLTSVGDLVRTRCSICYSCSCILHPQRNVHSTKFVVYMCDNVLPVCSHMARPGEGGSEDGGDVELDVLKLFAELSVHCGDMDNTTDRISKLFDKLIVSPSVHSEDVRWRMLWRRGDPKVMRSLPALCRSEKFIPHRSLLGTGVLWS